ncbi:AraC family transcriptional regulator [Asticcacaulis excentricus]|uniref:AraC family transcriptional regulator n=1 Tax=Asticcacaulis excentricus TaxID=78587 RepID=UPI000F83CACA|nr:AraC family transcriptional regulator [Asticcacaulis excentricus]
MSNTSDCSDTILPHSLMSRYFGGNILVEQVEMPDDDNTLVKDVVSFGSCVLVEEQLPAMIYRRSRRQAEFSPLDHYVLVFNHSVNATLKCPVADGVYKAIETGPHSVHLLSLSHPYWATSSGGARSVLYIRRDFFTASNGSLDSLLGHPIRSPYRDLLFDVLKSLMDASRVPSTSDLKHFFFLIRDILSAYAEENRYMGDNKPLSPISVKANIRDYLVKNISDSHLSFGTLVSEFNLSKTTLYRLFDPEGGVTKYINQLRGVMAARRIRDMSHHAHLHAEARKIGLRDSKQFLEAGNRYCESLLVEHASFQPDRKDIQEITFHSLIEKSLDFPII